MERTSHIKRRLIVTIDAEAYSSRDERAQAKLQTALANVLDRAGEASGVHRDTWIRQQAGDSELAILPDAEVEATIIDQYVDQLLLALSDHNDELRRSARLRLRMAVHFGVAYEAAMGYAGQGVVRAVRLRDSQMLRDTLLLAPDCDLVLALTRRVYEDTVVQRHSIRGAKAFRRLAYTNKEQEGVAYVVLPGGDVHGLDFDAAPALRPRKGRPERRESPQARSAEAAETSDATAGNTYEINNTFEDTVNAEVIGMTFGSNHG